jgi:hypothetical protein
MNALVFLGIAAGLSLVGCGVLWLRSRQPRSMDAHIRDFARELDALAPGSPIDPGEQRPQQPTTWPQQPGERTRRPERPGERAKRPERPGERASKPRPPPSGRRRPG